MQCVVCSEEVCSEGRWSWSGLLLRAGDQADRAISKAQLHALPRVHMPPIDVMVYHGSQGVLVLRWVSRLDAFSGYPVRT